MNKFKVGDRVRRVSDKNGTSPSVPIGTEFTVHTVGTTGDTERYGPFAAAEPGKPGWRGVYEYDLELVQKTISVSGSHIRAGDISAGSITVNTFASDVDTVLQELRHILVSKNAAYGNSALDPVRVFSTADTAEALRVRIDDKISRLARGAAAGEDTVLDLMGYLVLLKIAEKDSN